jgi:hypothetical protein
MGAGGSAAAPKSPGVAGTCPSCNATAAAEGNIDNDATLDSWYISTSDATGITGACGNADQRASAGEPYNQSNDVSCGGGASSGGSSGGGGAGKPNSI